MKTRVTYLALAVLLFASPSCRSMNAQNGPSELVPIFRVTFFTPESTGGSNGTLLTELEGLLNAHVKPDSLTSTRTGKSIEVRMHFTDKQSCEDAGLPTALVIQLFSAAHQDVRYDDPPCIGQQSH